MGFHKRHISNDNVISMFHSNSGVQMIRSWYTRGVDALITESGLASQVGSILSDDEWSQFGPAKQDEEIVKIIRQHLGVEDLQK